MFALARPVSMVVLKMMLHLGIPFTSYTLISLDSERKKAQECVILQKTVKTPRLSLYQMHLVLH